MATKTAHFVTSSSKLSECPADGLSEYAFIGRSNVGKSSLINRLTGVRGLAKTSQTPGKTQLINHFIVDDRFYIVDLPGYGYAKVPSHKLLAFKKLIRGYIFEREELVSLFLLIDIRHAPMKIDLDFIRDLGEAGIPFAIVFTKADKLSKTAIQRSVASYQERLLEEWDELPPIFVTSSETGAGTDELLTYIEQIETSLR